MRTIHKFKLEIGETTVHAAGGTVMSVGLQDDHPHVWILVETDWRPLPFSFRVVLTGEDISDMKPLKFLGTLQNASGFVLHVFQVPTGQAQDNG